MTEQVYVGFGGAAGGKFTQDSTLETTAYRGAILQLDNNFLLQLDNASLLLKLENG